MANIFYSNLSQDYGYENSGELVKIELIFKISGGVDKTITASLVDGDSYTPTQIWDEIKAAWNAYAWGFTAPILTIDHLNEIGTSVETISTIAFQSMKIYYNENNPRSFELPMILGALDYMPIATGVYTLSLGNDFSFQMPFMGSWRMQCTIDTGYGFTSAISNWTPIKAKTESSTDISRTKVSNGPAATIRGYKLKIDLVPYKYLKSFDLFLDFASRGTAEIVMSIGIDLFGNNTTAACIWGEESGEEALIFDQEQLMSYEIGLLPKSNLEA